ncbi:MAG: hypothetical protein LC704_10755, partial [Actinobacteria bacterium]|nr:hypothetical protein [Actinomycetota bacterium]
VRQQLASSDDAEELAARHADLSKRLATKHQERDRYIRLCAQGYITEGELDAYLADLRTQTDNLGLLLEAVEGDLARRHQEAEIAASTEAWLVSLRERIHEVEGDSEEAFRARRQIVRLLVGGIIIEDKRKGDGPRVRITYRFEEPEETPDEMGGEPGVRTPGIFSQARRSSPDTNLPVTVYGIFRLESVFVGARGWS